jgi:hypothetical protein
MEVADGATLEVSFVGYKSQTQSVEADSKYSFQMASGNLLEEVVVTSLGIKREAKALCYAVQNVTSETIAKSNATEALNGIEVLQPVCDSQASIYDEVHPLLNSARQNLNQNDGGLPLSGDLIYSGDASLWIKATHAIEDRAYVHQGLLSNSNYTSALSSINQAFGSNEEDMTFKFGSSATTAAPWYQFNRDRGDIGFHPTFGDALASYNDPRLDIYDGDGSSLYGDVYDSHEFFTIDQAVSLVSYSELQFVKAESLIATGGSQENIKEAYFTGIKSSFSSLGLSEEDFDNYVLNIR